MFKNSFSHAFERKSLVERIKLGARKRKSLASKINSFEARLTDDAKAPRKDRLADFSFSDVDSATV